MMLSNSIIILSSYLAAIGLDATSDAVRDNGNKKLSHVLEALMLAVFLSMPFTFSPDVLQWPLYILSYVFLRVALFDIIYNKTRRIKKVVDGEEVKESLPICYHGTVSWWDKLWKRVPCGWELALKFVLLVVGVCVPFQLIR